MSWLPLRAVLAFVALPGVVAFLVPWVLLDSQGADRPFHLIGAVPFTLGTLLLLWCVVAFYRQGRGTLAPWDTPKELVVGDPHDLRGDCDDPVSLASGVERRAIPR